MGTAADRLEQYTAEARKIVHTVLGISFEDEVWQLPYNRAHLRYIKKLNWQGSPAGLTNLGKAITANESLPNNGAGQFGGSIFPNSIRRLGEILGDRDVTTLCWKDFDLAARAMSEREPPLSAGTLASYAENLKLFVEICNLRRLTETRIEWKNPFPAPIKGSRERTIPPEVLRAFGEIRATILATDDNEPDRLLVHAITILLCTGMRVGELISLPKDCWHEGQGEDDEGRIIKGYWLGYSPEKRGLTENTFPRWIPTALVSLVKESVDGIIQITDPARENARALGEGWVNLSIDLNKQYDLREAAALLGFGSYKSVRNKLQDIGIATWEPRRKSSITGMQISEYVRFNSSIAPVMTDPFRLDLKDALFVIPYNFFSRRYSFVMAGSARPMTPHQLQVALKSNGSAASLFQRFGKCDPRTGKPFSFSPHDPRHTLTNWQIKHGIDQVEVAAYFGRNVERPERSNSAYIHLTRDEAMELVDRALETGRFQGGWAEAIVRIKDPVRREEVRHLLAGNVSFSQLGICSHPEGTTPPTMPEACSRCPGLIVIPGSQGHQKRALEIQAEIEEKIATYQAQVAEGVFMAGKWLDLEYDRQAKHRRVIEVLFSKATLEPGEEPTLVQMGNSKSKEC